MQTKKTCSTALALPPPRPLPARRADSPSPKGLTLLAAVLNECEECRDSLMGLLQVAYLAGHLHGHAEEADSRRSILLTAVTGILAVILLAGGFFFWGSLTSEEARIHRIYTQMSPAVANIQVASAGVTGSGVVINRAGYILTNYHVIREARNDLDIIVQLPGLGEIPAHLVGYDPVTDLAILKVEAPPDRLTIVRFGDSYAVDVGDLAVAIGNPFRLSHSLTVGHISAVGRRFASYDDHSPAVEGVLQTDAAINPGNSGGPLFNLSGQMIGINTRIESPNGGSVGLGFAIPSNLARQISAQIIARNQEQPLLADHDVDPQMLDGKAGWVQIVDCLAASSLNAILQVVERGFQNEPVE